MVEIRHTNRQIGGPDWTQVFVGSEGTLGIITAARLRLQPLPEHRVFRGWLFPTTKDAIGVMRATMLDGLKPAVVRLYDPLDTKMVGADPHETKGQAGVLKSLLSGSGSGLKHRVMRTILGLPSISNAVVRRWKGPVLLVTMTEGEKPTLRRHTGKFRYTPTVSAVSWTWVKPPAKRGWRTDTT